MTILSVTGKELFRGEACDTLREQVAVVLARSQAQRIVLNLAGVSKIDQTGIGALVRVFQDTREHGGKLKLICPEGEVLRVLRLTKLISVFEVFATEAEALASFE
jgi:anti-sigma B factor antagonist